MGRLTNRLNKHTYVAYGSDHALGYFVDVFDNRYKDGDEPVIEWSDKFGFRNSPLKVALEALNNHELLIPIVNQFIKGQKESDNGHNTENLKNDPDFDNFLKTGELP